MPAHLHVVINLKSICKILDTVGKSCEHQFSSRTDTVTELNSGIPYYSRFRSHGDPGIVYEHSSIVSSESYCSESDLFLVGNDKINRLAQEPEHDSRSRYNMAHHRLKLLTQFHSNFIDSLLRLFKSSHYSIILHVELIIDRSSLRECLVCGFLLSHYLIDM